MPSSCWHAVVGTRPRPPRNRAEWAEPRMNRAATTREVKAGQTFVRCGPGPRAQRSGLRGRDLGAFLKQCSGRPMVRTSDFQSGNTGSIPVPSSKLAWLAQRQSSVPIRRRWLVRHQHQAPVIQKGSRQVWLKAARFDRAIRRFESCLLCQVLLECFVDVLSIGELKRL